MSTITALCFPRPASRNVSRTASVLMAWTMALVMGVALHAAQAPVPEGWVQKYDEAVTAAKKSGRPILADFTGTV